MGYNGLSEYREGIRYMTCFITIVHCIFGFIQIHEFRTRGQCRVEPLLGAIFMAFIQYYRNLMAADEVKENLNLLALLFYSGALFLFYISGNVVFKRRLRRKVLYTIGLMLLGVSIIFFANERFVAMVIRALTTLTVAITMGAPILKLPYIIATETSEGVSLEAMTFGCGISILWILYGMAWNDYAIVSHNISIFFLELIPLLICIGFKLNNRRRTQRGNNINSNVNNDRIQRNIVQSPLPQSSPLQQSSSLRLSLRPRPSNNISLTALRSSLSLISAISTTGQT